MKIIITNVFVEEQAAALRFYTEVLGFVKKHDVPVGEFRWLTVVASENQEGPELLLEPNDNPVAKIYQEGLFGQGIPAASFGVTDVRAEYRRLAEQGVRFTMEPAEMGGVTVAVLDDTCGNLIQLMQV